MNRIMRAVLFYGIVGCSSISGSEYYVSQLTGSDSTGNGTSGSPWKTIQHALDQATGYSTDVCKVYVARGTYTENVSIGSWAEIYGGYNETDWSRDVHANETTIVAALSDPPSPTVAVPLNSAIDGFTVERGWYGISGLGLITNNTVANSALYAISGGMAVGNVCYEAIFPSVARENIVLDVFYGEAGILCSRNTVCENNFVYNCQKGIRAYDGAKVNDNIISRCNWYGIEAGIDVEMVGNTISDTGAAIYGDTINGVIEGNVITRCYYGISFNDGNPVIRNNVITGCGQGITSANGWPAIRNCVFWDNGDDLVYSPWDIKYCLTGEGYPGEGNISCDPKCVGWGPFTLSNPLYADVNYTGDVENGTAAHPYKSIWKALAAYDFHLSVGSPCIGAGEGGVDMGAYPGVASYSPLCSPSARIDVLPGTYYEQDLFPGNRVWLHAVDGPWATIVEGTGDEDVTPRVFGLTERAIVEGFTIKGAQTGVYCETGSNVPELRPVLLNCIFSDCVEDGVRAWYWQTPAIASCLVLRNVDVGIWFDRPGDVVNTIAWGNGYGMGITNGPPGYRLRNCIFWGNTEADHAIVESMGYMMYCDLGQGAAYPTNFSEYPKFVDPYADDFHIPADSPCRNRGTEEIAPVFDFDGRLHGQGGAVDVGAYEYDEGWVWSFDGGTTQGWRCESVPGVFAPPEGLPSGDGLLLRATSATNCFGYWQNDVRQIAYAEDSVYELRWETQRTVSGAQRYPTMRLRTNTDNLEESTMYVINDTRAALTSGTQTAEYRLYLARPEPFLQYPGYGYRKLSDTERLLLAFDMLNFDPAGDPTGEILLDNLDATHSRYEQDWTATELMSYDFASGAEGWTFSGEVAPFTAPQGSWASGELALQSTTNTGCFGFWESEVIELPTTASQTLLCATFTVKSDEVVTTAVPTLRLRIIREDSSEAIVKTLESAGNATRSPGTTPRDYTLCYWLAPDGAPYRLRLAFDLLNFNPDDSATATLLLDNVSLQAFYQPHI